MDDQKLENLLNLALDSTEEEQGKSLNLGSAYDRLTNRWEIIVKYNGDISFLEAQGVMVTTLYGGYAILNTPAGYIETIAALPQIEYMEIPKRLYFGVNQGKTASCIPAVQVGSLIPDIVSGSTGLTGSGVYVGIVDSGIDLSHPDFRGEDGTTRVKWLWDQTDRLSDRTGTDGGVPGENGITEGEPAQGIPMGKVPEGYRIGVEYSEAEINRLLELNVRPLPGADNERHGTGVAGIAAGNGRDSNGRFAGVAPLSQLIVVKLGLPKPDSFPRTSELMQALNYVIEKAAAERTPVAINVSVGNTYGPHDGSSLLERYLDGAIGVGRTQIIIGSGNEGDADGHASGRLENPVRGREEQTVEIELAVGNYEAGLNIQLWKSYADQFEVSLVTPSGQTVGPFSETNPVSRHRIEGADVLVLYGEPSPYRAAQEIYLDFIPAGDYLESGIYRLRLRPVRIVDGVYHLWLPGRNARNDATRFLQPTPETTLTIPSTAQAAVSVGAYDPQRETYAVFSGRGFTRTGQIKPDLAAPGVNIISAAPGGGYAEYTGTSFAAPFVTGSTALLMEWGIVRGNDPYLYGEKIKAYLIRGAGHLEGFEKYPNQQLGWGTLCLSKSIPT